MTKPRIPKQHLLSIVLILLVIGGVALILRFVLVVVNSDFYGRLTQTVVAKAGSDTAPVLRLSLHRLLPDENAIEASLTLRVPTGDLAKSIRSGQQSLVATVHDAIDFYPYNLPGQLQLGSTSCPQPMGEIVVISPRFVLPTVPSVNGFPYDDVGLLVLADVSPGSGLIIPFTFEVQKALPGRSLSVDGRYGSTSITLRRSSTEKALVVTASAIFILLSLVLASALFRSSGGLRGWQEIAAVAGYLVAAASFRDIVGVTRNAGVTALEVVIFGIPLVVLTVAVLISLVRARRGPSRE